MDSSISPMGREMQNAITQSMGDKFKKDLQIQVEMFLQVVNT
jgi:hypothetical protein